MSARFALLSTAALALMLAAPAVDAVIAVAALQVGYALGIVGRAMLGSWRQRRGNLVRLPRSRISQSRSSMCLM